MLLTVVLTLIPSKFLCDIFVRSDVVEIRFEAIFLMKNSVTVGVESYFKKHHENSVKTSLDRCWQAVLKYE